MYLTTVRQTVAIDAATCRPRWRHTWEPRDYELWPMNRGVALARGYVVRGTADGYLLALDAKDGQLMWARHVARPHQLPILGIEREQDGSARQRRPRDGEIGKAHV